MGLVIAPGAINSVIYRRATFLRMIRWRHGPTKESATPVDLTGAHGRAYIFPDAKTDAAALVSLTPQDTDRHIQLGDASGLITLRIAPQVTQDLPVHEDAVLIVEVVWPDGDVCRVAQGRCPIMA